MIRNRISTFVFLALILGASALAVGIYSMVNFQVLEGPQGSQGLPGQDGDDGLDGVNGTDGIDGINGTDATLNNVVAVWDSLSSLGGPAASYYIAFSDMRVNNTTYLPLNQTNSTIVLTRSGWYRLTIRCLLRSLTDGAIYWLSVQQNGSDYEILERLEYSGSDGYHGINAVVYIPSTGTTEYRLSCFGGATFEIYTGSQNYNQLAIEYVGAY